MPHLLSKFLSTNNMEKQNDTLRPVSIEEVQKMLEVKSLALEKLQSELEIETALERVRAVAMSMKKSKDLFDVCEVMYKELTALNFTNIRNVQIAINLDEYKSWLIFEYSKYGEIKMKKVDIRTKRFTFSIMILI